MRKRGEGRIDATHVDCEASNPLKTGNNVEDHLSHHHDFNSPSLPLRSLALPSFLLVRLDVDIKLVPEFALSVPNSPSDSLSDLTQSLFDRLTCSSRGRPEFPDEEETDLLSRRKVDRRRVRLVRRC